MEDVRRGARRDNQNGASVVDDCREHDASGGVVWFQADDGVIPQNYMLSDVALTDGGQ